MRCAQIAVPELELVQACAVQVLDQLDVLLQPLELHEDVNHRDRVDQGAALSLEEEREREASVQPRRGSSGAREQQ
jgi:hypothetical protein